MAKFVEVLFNGEPVLMNLDKVAYASQERGRCAIYCNGIVHEIDEPYLEMKQLIVAAQGGIPMEPGRMYDEA